METLSPVILTLGDNVVISPDGSSQPIKGYVFYNASPLVLGITSGSASTYLQPNSSLYVAASTATGNVTISPVTSTSSSSTTGTLYPTAYWINDPGPISPTSAPLTEVQVASGATINANVTNATFDVINSPGTAIGVGSDQVILYQSTTISVSGTIPAGGSITEAIATILNSAIPPVAAAPSPCHALAWFTNLSISASVLPVNWAPQLIDTDGHIYLQPGGAALGNGGLYANIGPYTENVNPVGYINTGDNLTLQVVVEGSSGATFTVSGTVIVIAYTSSIPPRSAIDSIANLYGGTLNEVNLVGLVQNLPQSTYAGLNIADMLAPADGVGSSVFAASANTSYNMQTFASGAIVRKVNVGNAAAGTEFLWGINGTNEYDTYADGPGAGLHPGINDIDLYIPPGSILTVEPNTAGTYRFTWTYTTL